MDACFGASKTSLRHTFFDLTQGIPDLAVKLYYLAQRHAINEKIEQVTPDLLKRVSETSLVQNKRYLEDLRAGRTPKDKFVYEDAYAPQNLALDDERRETKKPKAKKRPQAPSNAPVVNLPGIDVREDESTYDAAKRNGLIHDPDAKPPETA